VGPNRIGFCGETDSASTPVWPFTYTGGANKKHAIGPTTGDPNLFMFGFNARAASGGDVPHAVIDPTKNFELMSYCRGDDGGRGLFRWPSGKTYEALFKEIGALSAASSASIEGAPAPQLVVQGSVDALTNEVTFGPALTVTLPPQTPPAGSYSIKVLSSSGDALQQVSFAASRAYVNDSKDVRDSFAILVPDPGPSASKIVLLKNRKQIGSMSASASVPTVHVTSPNGGPVSGDPVTVQWTSGDADGGTLAATLQFSPDGGTDW